MKYIMITTSYYFILVYISISISISSLLLIPNHLSVNFIIPV